MPFYKMIEYLTVFFLLISTILTCYVFIITIIFKEKTFGGFYSSWQFPMLLALLIDAVFYKHISNLKIT
jgi:hypothetical protein